MTSDTATPELETWLWGANVAEPRILHTMIRVADFEASVRFYVEGFGMKVLDRFSVESRGAAAIYIGFNDYRSGGVLELVQHRGDKTPYTHGTGYGHFAVGVADVPAMVARLEAMGAEVDLRPKVLMDGGPQVAFVKDPDGYLIELIQTQRN